MNTPELPKPSPSLEAIVGDETYKFDYSNTILIGFYNDFQETNDNFDYTYMNNIRHVDEEGESVYIYKSQNLWRELARLCFTRVLKPYPEEDDFEDYAQFFSAELNNEVNYGTSLIEDDDDYEED